VTSLSFASFPPLFQFVANWKCPFGNEKMASLPRRIVQNLSELPKEEEEKEEEKQCIHTETLLLPE